LGALKLRDWLVAQGQTVTFANGDPGLFAVGYETVYLSIVFSWHAQIARDIALRVRSHAEVSVGGPGIFALAKWWGRETSLAATTGLDWRFERQRGDYRMAFASRGCPVNCWFCVVPRIEGTAFTLDHDFRPAPILCDNNLSALPDDFQNEILARYAKAGVRLIDANSGFEPRSFTEETFRRWRNALRGPWRFACDTTSELPQVQRMMTILREVPARRKQVYVLVGNEPLAACYERAQKVIEWGGEPYCQPVMPLNALSRDRLIIRHGWTLESLRDFSRFYNRHLWRSLDISEYLPRPNEARPFAAAAL
jgi:hypothetical protein